jgi:3-oxoadipate enol-lactonase
VTLVLIAPAPPTPMPVPEDQRAAMLRSYGSREGVLHALSVLAGSPLSPELRERVIEDTLRGRRMLLPKPVAPFLTGSERAADL